MKVSTGSLAVAGILLLGLTACAGATPAPTPTSPSSASPTSTPTATAAPTDPDEGEVTAAVVVMTASTLSVFGADGSALASVNYEMDGAAAAAAIAAALDTEPVVTPIAAIGDEDGPCPAATNYDFGGLELRWPGSLWAVGSYEVIVTGTATAEGVAIETVAGQRIGATRAGFRAAVGEFLPISDEPSGAMIGYDIVNPEAHEWDRIGALAIFADDSLTHLSAPVRVGFIGSCA
jgi:hypothetical protein